MAITTVKIGDAAITDAKIGNVSANKINTGTLNGNVVNVININAANISTGTMLADRIKGGTLELGGLNDANGVLLVKDSSGNTVATLDRNGLDTSSANITGGQINISTATDTTNAINLNWATSYATRSMELSPSDIYLRGENNNAGQRYMYINADTMSQKQSSGSLLWEIRSDIAAFYQSGGIHSDGNISTSGNLYVSGQLYISGSKSRKIETKSYGERLQYCYETATPYFGDIGAGKTDDSGVCYIDIDNMFQETVSCGCNYHVFLQKEGERDLWVDVKSSTFFIVRGTPGLAFSWELKVRQRDYEYERLETIIEDDYEEPDYASIGMQILMDYYQQMEEV